MDQLPKRINPNRQLNTLEEVALRLLCHAPWDARDTHKQRVEIAFQRALIFLEEAERRNPSGWGGE